VLTSGEALDLLGPAHYSNESSGDVAGSTSALVGCCEITGALVLHPARYMRGLWCAVQAISRENGANKESGRGTKAAGAACRSGPRSQYDAKWTQGRVKDFAALREVSNAAAQRNKGDVVILATGAGTAPSLWSPTSEAASDCLEAASASPSTRTSMGSRTSPTTTTTPRADVFDRAVHGDFFLPLSLEHGRNIIFDNSASPSGSTSAVLAGTQEPRPKQRQQQHALLRGSYLVPLPGSDQVVGGATHTRLNLGDSSKQDVQLDAIKAAAVSEHLLPALRSVSGPEFWSPGSPGARPWLGTSEGVRALTERSHLGRLPLAGRHPCLRNTWLLTGMGGRGLIHHAHMAELVVRAALNDDPSQLPPEVQPAGK
jgi:hypothetical protein